MNFTVTDGSTGETFNPKDHMYYHGTSHENAASIQKNGFRLSTGGMLGPGLYLSRDYNKARRHGPFVFGLMVNPKKSIMIDSQSHPLRTTWQNHGYDSAWVPANRGVTNNGFEETCIKSISQILVTITFKDQPNSEGGALPAEC